MAKIHQKLYLEEERVVLEYVRDNSRLFAEILFTEGAVQPLDTYEPSPESRVMVHYGIVGVVEPRSLKYLIVIAKRVRVGKIKGKSAYRVQRVSAVPLNFELAKGLFLQTLKTVNLEPDSSAPSPMQNRAADFYHDAIKPQVSRVLMPSLGKIKSSLVAISDSFSKDRKGTSSPGKLNSKKSIDKLNAGNTSSVESLDNDDEQQTRSDPFNVWPFGGGPFEVNETSPTEMIEEDTLVNEGSNESVLDGYYKSVVEQRVLDELSGILCAGTFFFSYEYDLTNSSQRLSVKPKPAEGKMAFSWSQADDRFWWNKFMLKDFIDKKLDPWILPVMQGYVFVSPCKIEKYEFDFVLISRRSRYRNGLRYQRRGLDPEGNVANYVETEQILLVYEADDADKVHTLSFVQTRGSIPLYWSQSPTSRKPVPQLEKSEEENVTAMTKHFNTQRALYGPQTLVCLVETHGKEAIIGAAYKENIAKLKDDKIKFKEFDFHKECQGMRFENMKNLINSVSEELENGSFFWASPQGILLTQDGNFRTNCMDCLDRTNVVQSSLARYIINKQLLRIGVHASPENGLGYYVDFEIMFNNAWANNGDAISIAYTNTSALKGDVTRTGKRNVFGLMNDGASSVLRMIHNNFLDAFRQDVIDFALGIKTNEVFDDKQQENEVAKNHSDDDKQIEEAREEAIQIVKSLVLPETEQASAMCWIVNSLESSILRFGSIISFEKILILTENSFYTCIYDYHLEKIAQLKRMSLQSIQRIEKGPWKNEQAMESEEDFYGFSLVYSADGEKSVVHGGAVMSSQDMLQMTSAKKANQRLLNEVFWAKSGQGFSSKDYVEEIISKFAAYYFRSVDLSTPYDKEFIVEKPLASSLESKGTKFVKAFTGLFKKKQQK